MRFPAWAGKGLALGIGAGGAALGAAGVSAANDLNKAMNDLQASTGLAKEKMDTYEGVLRDIYTNNYGESFEDVSLALSTIRSQIGPVVDHWDPSALQDFTESAFALRDTFGYEIQESVRAASAMMEHFGIDGNEAFSMIAAGAQNGLDFSGELLDSISEYSVQFAKIGLDADDMFKIMQKGADTGAFNLDKIGDAVKEFGIRVVDGSETTKQGFKDIGLNADEMAAKFGRWRRYGQGCVLSNRTGAGRYERPPCAKPGGRGPVWNDVGGLGSYRRRGAGRY